MHYFCHFTDGKAEVKRRHLYSFLADTLLHRQEPDEEPREPDEEPREPLVLALHFDRALFLSLISLCGVKRRQSCPNQVIDDSSQQDRRGHWSPGSSLTFLTRCPHPHSPV